MDNNYLVLLDVEACSFLAMAHQRLGHGDDAKMWFHKMLQQNEKLFHDERGRQISICWNGSVTVKLLINEATAVSTPPLNGANRRAP